VRKPRVLVFVIAYYAEKTLRWVLDRIPRSIFEVYDCEVLVVDDASNDDTFRIGREYGREHPELRLTVLRNRFNRGYGGNQKVGYAYAITEGFEHVVMVHGDGQYAPEELHAMIEPLADGRYDAVLGTRMADRDSALRGGMPLYKYVGNRILSTFQNAVLGTRLTEFHSGYRAYSVELLRRIPFALNTDDFHFDTEIIVQLLQARARVLEHPIPTYYGDEICRVDGMRYARDVAVATVACAAHRMGLFYQRRYDCEPEQGAAKYDLKLGFDSSHRRAIDGVKPQSRVLDLGGGTGALAAELLKKGCTVTVVDPEAPLDPPAGIDAIRQDLDDEPRFPVAHDTILLLDVIEHLADPELFLDRLRTKFDWEPRTVIMTTPNVAFGVQRVMLLLGQFNYGRKGILDRTHKRLFTFRTFERLVSDAGLRIRAVKGIPAPLPKVLGEGAIGKAALAINKALIRLSPELFSYQIWIEAETTPTVQFVLDDTRAESAGFKTLPPPRTSWRPE
jgi:glycosyltransferase involved in cell wall biosynthesis